MASSSIKHVVAEALKAYIAARVSGLTITTEAADADQKLTFPSLQIIPRRMSFEPFQSDIVAGDDDQTVLVEEDDPEDEVVTDAIFEVGTFEGPVELRLAAKSQPQREQFQAAILGALCSDLDRAGVASLTLSALQFEVGASTIVTTATSGAAVFLDGDDWDDEMVWEQARFCSLDVSVQFPMLVFKRDIPIIDELVLQLTGDVDSDFDDIPASAIESVTVDEDGELAPYVP